MDSLKVFIPEKIYEYLYTPDKGVVFETLLMESNYRKKSQML